MIVLLGGVHHLWGAFAGSVFLVGLGSEIGRHFEYWRGSLGLLIMLLMVFAPEGMLGLSRLKKQAGDKAL
jgi:branched-chain amino acid transport system permease protein